MPKPQPTITVANLDAIYRTLYESGQANRGSVNGSPVYIINPGGSPVLQVEADPENPGKTRLREVTLDPPDHRVPAKINPEYLTARYEVGTGFGLGMDGQPVDPNDP